MEPIIVDVISEVRRVLMEEAAAISDLAGHIGENYVEAVRLIHNSKGMVIVVGMGKSGLVGRKISATLSSLGTPATFLHAAEALHGDLGMIKPDDVLLMISNSGQTRELIEIIPYARRVGAKIIAITHNVGSELSKNCDALLPLRYASEACPFNLAPTTSTTMSMAIGDALAVTLTKLKDFQPKNFAELHPGGSLGRRLLITVADLMHTGAELPVVGPGVKLIDALSDMTAKKFGTLIVADDGGKLLGIVTDGDLRRLLYGRGGVALDAPVADVMIKNPKRIGPAKLCEEAINVMEKYKITTLPVVGEGEEVLGLIHLHDLLRAKIY